MEPKRGSHASSVAALTSIIDLTHATDPSHAHHEQMKPSDYEAGRAEAFGALCSIFSSQPCGEPFLPIYLARFYHALAVGLQYDDEVMHRVCWCELSMKFQVFIFSICAAVPGSGLDENHSKLSRSSPKRPARNQHPCAQVSRSTGADPPTATPSIQVSGHTHTPQMHTHAHTWLVVVADARWDRRIPAWANDSLSGVWN